MSSSRTVRENGGSAAEQVRRILELGLGGEWPSSEQVAARLSVSLQHLRRRLREEGTSIGQIREQILKDAAIASLTRGDEPVSELSARLGFSEPSAFRRAFRRWTGRPPGAYRSAPDPIEPDG
jgi:AraC-like DNA-binding protein